jgi:hypothetical protein
MPAVVVRSTPTVARVVSTPIVRSYSYGYNPYSYSYSNPYYYSSPYYAPYTYPYYSAPYSYPYSYPYSTVYPASVYAAPAAPTTIVVAPPASSTTYGTCKATTGVGVTSNSCAPGKTAVSTVDNGCMCADQTTGLAGCGNVLNGVCK